MESGDIQQEMHTIKRGRARAGSEYGKIRIGKEMWGGKEKRGP